VLSELELDVYSERCLIYQSHRRIYH